MNTPLPTPSPCPAPQRHAVGAEQTCLLHLQAGSELRCLQGPLQVQLMHTGGAGAAPLIWSLPTHGAWRCPVDGWVSLRAGGPQGARYGLQAAPAQGPNTDLPIDTRSDKAKKNRPGLIDLGRWWRRLGRIRPWQRAA
ncbi:hypothetical protein PSQ40_18255 [Curvibacter sp. HBC61]|uniref:DUF2917 domain-containing protein n=1 Tax=Curvibacter cyanobacteriorum TaxID=3026422 RepID=A0ABT5N2J1_9BURK|nr:hypothetical protein [Curvibacter sp. HBC61]MDD0840528.1 hypothetical protein [Curvibacter sp. HBC61]